MTKTELNTFRKNLETRRAELESEGRNRQALAIEASPDELDRIQHATERDYAMGYLERNSNRLREVRAALGRVGEGRFGICTGCDESINLKRLAAVPWASLCIVCQEAANRAGQMPRNGLDPSLDMAA